MEIKLYLQMLRKGWWIVVLTALVAVNIALAVSYFSEPTYLSSAKFVVSPNPNIVAGDEVVNSLEALDKRSIVATYAEFLNSRRFHRDAFELLSMSERDIEEYVITAVVLPETNILELTVTGPSPELTASLANNIGRLAIDNISRLYRAYDVSVLDPAVTPEIPISPQPLRDTSLALALGLIVGVTLAILNEQIRIPLDVYRQRLRLDSATGVFNARYFKRMLESEVPNIADEESSVGIVELRGFPEFKETLPPAVLQRLLIRVTEILRKELRGNDSIGRWSDNSFSVYLPSTAGLPAKSIFQRIYESLSESIDLPQYDLTVNLDPHIGGAVYSSSMSIDEFLEQAETALEMARQTNTDPILVWEINNPFWVGRK